MRRTTYVFWMDGVPQQIQDWIKSEVDELSCSALSSDNAEQALFYTVAPKTRCTPTDPHHIPYCQLQCLPSKGVHLVSSLKLRVQPRTLPHQHQHMLMNVNVHIYITSRFTGTRQCRKNPRWMRAPRSTHTHTHTQADRVSLEEHAIHHAPAADVNLCDIASPSPRLAQHDSAR